jgi:hypothetical protein
VLQLLTKNFSFEKLIAIATFDRASPPGECPVIWGVCVFCHGGTNDTKILAGLLGLLTELIF